MAIAGSRPPVIVIAGPTASGKSALALALAEQNDGVIVNAERANLSRLADSERCARC
jgi:tRNA dimethylallyltransferase